MITNIRLSNFKSWKSTPDISFSPITVLFGPNSSGKSSLIQFLLMLKQTVESRDRTTILRFGGSPTDYVDLGVYSDLIYDHEEERDLEFEIAWIPTTKGSKARSHYYSMLTSRLGDISFHGIVGKSNAVTTLFQAKYTSSAGYSLSWNDSGMLFETPDSQHSQSNIEKPIGLYTLPIFRKLGDLTPQATEIFRGFAYSFENLFENVYYIGPLREHPHRHYQWSGQQVGTVGLKGEAAVDALLADVVGAEHDPYDSLIGRVEYWLRELGMADHLQIESMDKRNTLFEVKVSTPNSSSDALITDVGFGVSQILPIIVQSYLCPMGSTLILEQPEIHLHAGVQAKLADFLVKVSSERQIQYVVESHSEHFLRGLQHHVASDIIKPNHISSYFIEMTKDGSQLKKLEFDAYGQISNWPEEFFGPVEQELMEMNRLRIERMKQDRGNQI